MSKCTAAIPVYGLIMLSACGGAATGPIEPQIYETLDSAANVSSTLAGVALRSNGATGNLSVVDTTGSITHASGALMLNDGVYLLSDANGIDSAGVATDGIAVVTINGSTAPFTGDYSFVVPYTQTYTSGGNSFDSFGVTGVVLNPVDLPRSGSASYQGEATASVTLSTQAFEMVDGRSAISANFGTRRLDLTLSGFTTVDGSGGVTSAPFDSLTIRRMRMSQSGFSGGALELTSGGTTVNPIGTSPNTTAEGLFFGYDLTNAVPDEVGGVILSEGTDGMITGAFIAD